MVAAMGHSSCRGDTEGILDRLPRPVASIEALSTMHWSMCSVVYWYITMATKSAAQEVHVFVVIIKFAVHIFGS